MSAPTGSIRFSFEVFPARTSAAALALGHAVQHLAAAGPEFISVTYGASGSTRDASLDLLRYLRQHTTALPLAHLTTVGMTRAEVTRVIHETLDAGIADFLALRGDVPQGLSDSDPAVAASLSAAELIALIDEVRAARIAGGDQSASAAASVDSLRSARTAVAVYPNGHPLSQSRDGDIEWLLQKQQAGATFGITQLFFHADEYLSFCADARAAGVTMEILPGVMPVSTLGQLQKVASLAGQAAPADLVAAFERAGGSSRQIGVDATVQLSRELLAGGAPSIHLYTFNRHEPVLQVLAALGQPVPHPITGGVAAAPVERRGEGS